MEELSFNVQHLLAQKHIIKNHLCKTIGISRSQLNRMCKNQVQRIDLTTLAKLCLYLDCTPNDLLMYTDARTTYEIN